MAKKQSNSEEAGELNFEEALARLEEIVRRLEEGDLGLQEALVRYEQGVKLLRQCYDLLQRAERRIELLSGVDADGNPVTKPLDDAALTLEEKAQRRSRRRSSTDLDMPPDGRGFGAGDTDMDASGEAS